MTRIILGVASVFFLFGLWHIALATMGLFATRKPYGQSEATNSPIVGRHGRVAVLLTVCDDFDEAATESVVNQHDVPFDLYILDDSTHELCRKKIDSWASRHGSEVVVLRRSTRDGFKAGNINNWLAHYGESDKYSHICLADADVVMPCNYLSLLCSAATASDPAFVQGCHQARQSGTWFEKAMGLLVASEWLGLLPGRNHWGLPHILGHGVLIKLADLIAVGGVPQVVSEDLALTIHLAESGRRGIICPQAIADERFPETLDCYRKRLRRWVAADVEIVRTYFTRILRSPLKPSEKADLLLRETRLPMLSVFVMTLLIVAVVAGVMGRSSCELPGRAAIIVCLMVWAGHLPVLWDAHHSVLIRIRFLLLAPYLSCGLLPDYLSSAWHGWRGRVAFDPTNSTLGIDKCIDPAQLGLTLLVGGVLMWVGMTTPLLSLAAVGYAMLTVPWLVAKRVGMGSILWLSLGFWLVFGLQWIHCSMTGTVPVEALLVVAGMSACRD